MDTAPGDSPTCAPPASGYPCQKGHKGNLMRTADSPTCAPLIPPPGSAGEEAFLQNSKFKIWPRGAAKSNFDFEFCGVGSQSVAIVASKRGGGSLLAKIKIQNLAADAAKF